MLVLAVIIAVAWTTDAWHAAVTFHQHGRELPFNWFLDLQMTKVGTLVCCITTKVSVAENIQ